MKKGNYMNISDLKKQLESQIKETIENGIGIIQAFQEIEDVYIDVTNITNTKKDGKSRFSVSVSIDTKPEKKKYRPYNWSELHRLYFNKGRMQYKKSEVVGDVTGFDKKGMFIFILGTWVNAKTLLEDWQYPNGDPCGVLED